MGQQYFIFQANFGEVDVPVDFTPPGEQTLGMLGYDPPLHNVRADNVVVVNARQLRVENLYYDGSAPGMRTTVENLNTYHAGHWFY